MNKLDKLAKALVESQERKADTSPYDTTATVTRIEGDTAWVHIPGGVDETPVKLTISAGKGDTVQVRVSGGTAYIIGNSSRPPTDDRVANVAKAKADTAQATADDAVKSASVATTKAVFAQETADGAQETAQDAHKIAADTAQYFWVTETGTDTGAHITEVSQEAFQNNPSGGNLLARSNGIAVRDGLTELAVFGANGATIGKTNGAHTVIDEDGMQIYSVDRNNNLVQLANIGYDEGQTESGTAIAPYYTLGTRASGSTVGNYSVAEGSDTTASGYCSHAEGDSTEATRGGSHAEGAYTTASNRAAHSEGWMAQATGEYSHAEGYRTIASDQSSHAEGNWTTASGKYSHAEGTGSTAIGQASHAQNLNTVTGYNYQTALGKYNENISTNAVEIGKGTSDNNRSNALDVSWSGNVRIALATNESLYTAINALGWVSDVIE